MKRFNLNFWFTVAVIVWMLVGVFGVFYNISYLDEAKYLIKGWLMLSGKVGYFSTNNFFYQHMPVGLLWFGLGQKFFGPSLLAGRLQSLLLNGVIVYLTYVLGKSLGDKKTGKISILILSLAPVVSLYYSAAVPQSLVITILLLAFIALAKKNYPWATVWFTLSMLTRENFSFTLIIYWLFLFFRLKSVKKIIINIAVSVAVLALFLLPGWPVVLKPLYHLPGLKQLMTIDKQAISIISRTSKYDFGLILRAIMEFGANYLAFCLTTLWGLIIFVKEKKVKTMKQEWWFLLLIIVFNFIAHTWGAMHSSPRTVISYFAYIAPLLAVCLAICIKDNYKLWLKAYLFLMVTATVCIRFASIAGRFNRPVHLQLIQQSIKPLQELTAGKDKIIWLSEPMALYLAGKVSYYPLINHTNPFKSSKNTESVRASGKWNEEMMSQWLNEAELVVIDQSRLSALSLKPGSEPTIEMINNKLTQKYIQIEVSSNIWPGNLKFYIPNQKTDN